MSTYYYLSCQQCGQYLHFGKMLHTQAREDNSALDEYVEVELDMLLHKRKHVRTESL